MIIKNNLKGLDKVEVILLDIDHTLTIPEDDEVTLREVLFEMNIPFKNEYVLFLENSIINAASKSVIRLDDLDNEFLIQLPFIKEHNLDVIDFRERIFESELKHVKAVANIEYVIKELYLEYDLYCFTDWFYDLAVSKVTKLGIIDKIVSIISSENKYSKKDLESFKMLLKELKKEPEQVIMIGDSITDVHSSKIGIQSILVDYDENKSKESTDLATSVVTSSEDIKKLLKRRGR